MSKEHSYTHTPGQPVNYDGNETPSDWKRVNNMTDEEIERAAKDDPDAQPWTDEQLKNIKIRRPNIEKKDKVQNGGIVLSRKKAPNGA